MKKIYAALIVALSLFGHSVSAQTNVSGFINANTTWTLAGSPYIVTGNALLSQGFTLTIDPGVVVRFGTNNALQIDGQLIAIGTPSQRIVFTSNQVNPQPGDWAKLHFSDFSVDAVFNAQGNYVSGTIMQYCDVLYAGSLMWGSIDIQQCAPYFNHCTIKLGSWCGINFNGDRLRLDSSRVTDLPKRGIYFQAGEYTLRNDTFIACAEGAIHGGGNGGPGRSRITDSYFRWNYGVISGSGGQVTILNSAFVYNAGPAVISLKGGGDTISCNKFRYNSSGPAVEYNPISAGGIVIHNNLIEYNVNNDPASWNGASVFYISGSYDTVFISNNTIRHNSSPGRSCCFIYAQLSGPTDRLQIYNNEFTENDGQGFMQIWCQQINDPSFDFLYMNSNTFINPLCTYELYNSVPYGSPNFFVDGNYWGSSSTSFVDGRIYDYFDFANQSVVYYMPILLTPVAVDTACQPFQLPVGVEELNSFSEGNLYPNPATNQFVVHSPATFSGKNVFVLLNSVGQEVKRVALTQHDQVISCEELAEGVYFYRIEGDSGALASGKFIRN